MGNSAALPVSHRSHAALGRLAAVSREPWKAPICEVSAGKIELLLDHEVEPGTVLPVELLNERAGVWHLKAMRVLRVSPHRERSWMVGSEFVKAFTDAEWRALLG
jgi:hypothetical protein